MDTALLVIALSFFSLVGAAWLVGALALGVTRLGRLAAGRRASDGFVQGQARESFH